jgi:reductive dehalogenase
MSQFHSNVSRRDFMKGLGLVGVGVGAAALTAPVYHDLDEMIASDKSLQPRPWYVKELDFLKPAQDIDWSLMNRFDRADNEAHQQRTWTKYRSRQSWDEHSAFNAAVVARRNTQQSLGFSLKFQALALARSTNPTNIAWDFPGITTTSAWAKTPDQRGVPKWTGSPEEASRMVQAAARYFGATMTGIAEMDDTWRNKLIVKGTTAGGATYYGDPWPLPASKLQNIVYENVDQAYMDASQGKFVIPNKPMYIIVMMDAMSRENLKMTNSAISKQNDNSLQRPSTQGKMRMFNFLKALGNYQLCGAAGDQTNCTNIGASDVLTGLGESSRQNNWTISPEMGPAHTSLSVNTDLPLAPTPPVDAGLFRFCATCGICANACPSGAISHDKEPSYEIPIKKMITGESKAQCFHAPGPKAFWSDMEECYHYYSGGSDTGGADAAANCWECAAHCVFADDRAAMIHSVVKGTVAKTSLFNSFFKNMDLTFGYGSPEKQSDVDGSHIHNPDDWWDQSLPCMGQDTTIAVGKGGWKRSV